MATGIKERIEKIKPYFISFNVIAEDDASYVLLRFPERWTIPDQDALKENYKVEIAGKQEGIYFLTELSNGTDGLFDAIDYVILFNKNVEERKTLLTEKIQELTTLFATESLENLKKLKFAIPEENSKGNAKSSKNNSKKEEKLAKNSERIVKIDKTSDAKKVTVEEVKSKEYKNKTDNNDNDLMSLAKGLTGE